MLFQEQRSLKGNYTYAVTFELLKNAYKYFMYNVISILP